MTTAVATPTHVPGRPAPATGGAAPTAAPLLAWCGFALVLIGRGYRAILLTLVAVALIPGLWSWPGFVVRSGSMEPSISVGDVVIGRPFGEGEKVPVGRVMVFQAPAGSGAGSSLRVHRVVARAGHDAYTTAGDANPSNDATPVPHKNFRARPVIRVPYVGLPLVWFAHRDLVRLALWLALTTLLLYFSFRPVDGARPRSASPGARRTGRPRQRDRVLRLRPAPQVGLRIAVAVGVAGAMLSAPSSATAAFTDTTLSGSNTWKASASLLQPYTAAVITDLPYAFHRLDEASGTNAADSSGNSRTGTYTNVATYQQTGALAHNPGYAIGLAANSGRMVAGGTGLIDPTTFSVEMWFKTSTITGGKLIGFENSRNAASTLFDREAFMRTDGKIIYMGGNSSSKLLTSPTALNNGIWHHLVITSIPAGSSETATMYVDGASVATGNANKATTSYTGWWRVGFGLVPIGSGYPTTGNFTGAVDDVAIYTTALSGTRVAAHYGTR